ncbi:hypothetical protein [Amycolatopsis acididurans]|uniref:hypothetical protein n=1 Tax=Amycolatopsis acididurans TaxID=2724524 RepID=UPI0028ACBD2A|nr:hypothetical protein [Amycolatopsis acididurans]
MIVNRRGLFVLVAGLGLASAAPASASPKASAVEVCRGPGAVVVNSATGGVYVAGDDGTLTILNERDVQVGQAGNVAVDESTGRVYVTNRGAGTVAVLEANGDPRSMVPCGPGATAPAVDAETGKLYVGSASAGCVAVVDTVASVVDAVLSSPVRGFEAMCVNPGPQVGYLTSPATNTVEVLDLASGKFTASVPVGKAPTGLAVHEASNTVYVANSGIHHLSVVDGDSRTERATILLRSEASSVAVHQASHTVYTNGGPDGIVKIDGATGAITGELSLGINPGQVAVHQRTGTVYVTDPVHDLLHVITDF